MRRDVVILREMIAAAEKIQRTIGTRDLAEIREDDITHDVLLWNFTILGEAANQLLLAELMDALAGLERTESE